MEPSITPQDNVEDTKGNNGDFGELTMTNLRITWVSKQQRRTNISLGLNCITSVTVKMVASRLRGERRRRSKTQPVNPDLRDCWQQ
jgi:Bardet-Biedl syndrome 5 protein